MYKRVIAMLCCLLLLSGCRGEAAVSTSTQMDSAAQSQQAAVETADAGAVEGPSDAVETTDTTEHGGVIRLASQFEVTGFEDVIAAFEDQYPQWTVEVEVLSQEELNLSLAADDAPDLLDDTYDNFSVLCRNGYLTDLSGLSARTRT